MALQASFTEEAEKLNSQYEWNLYKAILLATRRSFDFLRRHMYSAPNCNPFSPSASYPHSLAMIRFYYIFIKIHLCAYIRVYMLLHGSTNSVDLLAYARMYMHVYKIALYSICMVFRRHLRVFT